MASQNALRPETTAEVLIIYTGGTIGMKPTSTGLQPVKGYLPEYLSKLPQFHDLEQARKLTTPMSRFGRRVHYEIMEWDELLDSSNINQSHYHKMVADIEANYDKYDAFIIMHGTDTMAYTASALSFMMENLGKSVILTGSQVPFAQEPNDAAHNLLMSLTIAGHFEIPEVCIYFDHKLFRGNRSRKVSALGFDAFASLNLPALVKVGTELKVNWNVIRMPPPREEKVIFHKALSENVGVLKLFPGISATTIKNFLLPPLEGCVIETYGTGNAPSNRPEFLAALKEAIDRGVLIVNITQCPKGMVSHGTYATSHSLQAIGVLSGFDMTTETALAKLSYLLAHKDLSRTRVRELIGTSIRGELSSDEPVRFSFHDEAFLKSVALALQGSRSKSAPLTSPTAAIGAAIGAAAPPGPLVSLRASTSVLLSSPTTTTTTTTSAYSGSVGPSSIGSVYAPTSPTHMIHHYPPSESPVPMAYFPPAPGSPSLPSTSSASQASLLSHSVATSASSSESRAMAVADRGVLDNDLKNALFPVLLCAASQMGSINSLRSLLESGANPNCVYDGRTPLHIAAREGHLNATKYLVEAGAKVDCRDRWNATPLDDALAFAHTGVVEFLRSVNACESEEGTRVSKEEVRIGKVQRHPHQTDPNQV